MARIRCHYTDCVFLDDGYCSAAAIELDPDTGCATFTPTEEAAKEDWDEDEDLDDWEDDDALLIRTSHPSGLRQLHFE